jgi:cytochrome c oxidase accessory protein FixG
MHGVVETKGGKAESRTEPVTEVQLYADRVRVYPKKISGVFRRLKWALLAVCLAVYYLAPWIRWDRGPNAPDQALLIDMTGRRGYFFAVEIWPQEVYYIAGLLMLGAFALFLATTLAGRVWCGYACPQTAWTDLFMLVERLIEGDRNQRMRLDAQSLSVAKVGKKTLKHAAWLLISFATGGAWILYFGDAPAMVRDVFSGEASVEAYVFIALLTSTTYVLAGWAREQVCTYMCPWPRFQSAMLDAESLVVSYRKHRGEPRGSYRKGASWEGRGDCVDCKLCVVVCPTGIDIRDGLQLECIGCGLCVDACASIMDRVGRPRGLIAFDTERHLRAVEAKKPYRYRLARPRVFLYSALVLFIALVMGVSLFLRSSAEIHVLRERSPLFVALSDGSVRNDFTVKILNKARDPLDFALEIEGLPDPTIKVIGLEGAGPRPSLPTPGDGVATYRVTVAVPAAALKGEQTDIRFALRAAEGTKPFRRDTVFLGPRK